MYQPKDKTKASFKEKVRNLRRTVKKKLNRNFWIKLLIITSTLILIATSFLPYLL